MDKGEFTLLASILIRSGVTSLKVMFAMPQPDEPFEVAKERALTVLRPDWSPPETVDAGFDTRLAEFTKERERLRAWYDEREANPPERGRLIAFDFEAAAKLKRSR
jgi:hypothetical protein